MNHLEHDCKMVSGLVDKKTIVMDVCSVKTRPSEILQNNLGGKCQILATHPLFGPQSVEGADAAGKVIVWHELTKYDFSKLKTFFSQALHLRIQKLSPDDHDREMAWIHALSIFIGRGLLNIYLPSSELAANYYQQLRELHDIEAGHSLELFQTIQLASPYAKDVRDQFLHALESIESDLEVGNKEPSSD